MGDVTDVRLVADYAFVVPNHLSRLTNDMYLLFKQPKKQTKKEARQQNNNQTQTVE